MPRPCRCCLAASLLLALAVAAASGAAAPGLAYEARQEDTRAMPSDAHLDEATHLLAAEGATLASIWAAEKDTHTLTQRSSSAVATQGDDQSSPGGAEHGKEEGSGVSSKEGEKQGKSCLTKEECHKKKMLCGKGCTLSAHSKCAAKCTKSCVPTC
ncbi:hypothetical protein HU200_058019 [Digitaria exilis]|uniref:Uncharacterized protein n=1 Tax=Digitaria exilis TaxID=1010633 RepID=A0A835AGZ7_9POAL|nr:hypothetical protein HU200_058019 [Digitaria exilis]